MTEARDGGADCWGTRGDYFEIDDASMGWGGKVRGFIVGGQRTVEASWEKMGGVSAKVSEGPRF